MTKGLIPIPSFTITRRIARNTIKNCLEIRFLTITLYHAPSFTIRHHHSTSLTITQHHSPSLTITHHHSPLFAITYHHSSSLTITHHHSTPLIITQHRAPSLNITHLHSTSRTITQHLSPHSPHLLLSLFETPLELSAVNARVDLLSFIIFYHHLFGKPS